jgi:adenosyl cobinamide kinase/adenosyl cobinamide phosphate guanylyltransferase
MKIQLPTSLKVLRKQYAISAELRRKNSQLKDMEKFVDDLNKLLRVTTNDKIIFVRNEVGRSIYLQNRPSFEPLLFVPGMSQELVNQIKLEILRELGY